MTASWAQQRTCFKVKAARFECFLSPWSMQSDSEKQLQQAHMKQAQHSSLYLDLLCWGFWSSTAQYLNLKNTQGKKWRAAFTLLHDQYAVKRRRKILQFKSQHCGDHFLFIVVHILTCSCTFSPLFLPQCQ